MVARLPNSGVLVLPMSTPPASRNRRATAASRRHEVLTELRAIGRTQFAVSVRSSARTVARERQRCASATVAFTPSPLRLPSPRRSSRTRVCGGRARGREPGMPLPPRGEKRGAKQSARVNRTRAKTELGMLFTAALTSDNSLSAPFQSACLPATISDTCCAVTSYAEPSEARDPTSKSRCGRKSHARARCCGR